ncbi:MAG TPA: polysaccharide deacetylase family protein, partial [Clostridiales bacterium]|nr:polysaccharide deacetylase family protein [Clostridiales bacterium]
GLQEVDGDYYVGRLSHIPTWYFDGTVGYIAVYNRELSDQEWGSVYSAIRDEMATRAVVVPSTFVPPNEVLPITDGLVAAYDFQPGPSQSILYDLSGNKHHGTISGGTTWVEEGLQFDGVSGSVNLGDLGSLGEGYTILAAVKLNADTDQTIINRVGSTTPSTDSGGFDLWKTTGANAWTLWQFDGVGPGYAKATYDEARINEWQVLCARCDGSALSLGHNGRSASLTKSPASVATIKEHTGDYYIGRYAHLPIRYVNGTIAYIAVYNRALSASDVETVYNAIYDTITPRGIEITSHNLIDPMVVIAFDDGYTSDYTNAYRLGAPRNIPTTSYINTGGVGHTGRLTWDQIREMRAAGYGIECHTHDHINLAESTEEVIRSDLQAVNAAFVGAGLATPEHIAYPGGAIDDDAINIVSDYRATGRYVWTGPEVVGWWQQDVSWYRLRTQTLHAQSPEDVATIKAQIDSAIEHKYVLFLYTHKILETPGSGECHVDYFEEILDYIATKRDAGLIDPVTIDGLYRAMQGIRTHPATGPMTLHGEATRATYNKTVDYV